MTRVRDAQGKPDADAEGLEFADVPRQGAKRARREELPSLDEERDAVANSGGWHNPRY